MHTTFQKPTQMCKMATDATNSICICGVLSDLELTSEPTPVTHGKNDTCPWVFPKVTTPVVRKISEATERDSDTSEDDDEEYGDLHFDKSNSYVTDISAQNVSVSNGATVHIGPSVSECRNYDNVEYTRSLSHGNDKAYSAAGCRSCSSGGNSTDLALGDVSVKGDSNKVHVGNVKHESNCYNIQRAESVVIKHIKVKHYPHCTHAPLAPQPSSAVSDFQVRIVTEVQKFLQKRYLHRMSEVHPLPWCADFRLHLDEFYTTLQLVGGERRGGRTDERHTNMEKVLCNKNGDGLYSGRSCRVLIEGNPGYGKSTLTLRIATDWASGRPYVHRFTLVFLIQLRDFQGDLQDYIFKELYPQEREHEQALLWNYMRDNQENILFILDGLDELPRDKERPIYALLNGNLFDKANVIVTSRPVSSDNTVLSACSRRIAVRGFSQEQTEQFVRKYFQMHKKPQCATRLLDFVFGSRSTCHHLASCPLTCLLLCVLFDDNGDTLLNRVTDVYHQLFRCLIRHSNKRHGSSEKESERALNDFGELCLHSLARDTATFTSEELNRALHGSTETLLKLGLLVQSCTLQSSTRIQKDECYQLLHKTFSEFLAARYLYFLLQSKNTERFSNELLMLHSVRHEVLRLVLKFLVGLLGDQAHVVIKLLPEFNLKEYILYELLHECGYTPDNVKALSSVLSEDFVLVQTNQLELEAWAGILSLEDCIIRSVRLQWVPQPPLESLDFDAFLTALQRNHSVTAIVVTSSLGLQMEDTEIATMANCTSQVLQKNGLVHFAIDLPGDTYSQALVEAMANTFLQFRIPKLTSVAIALDLNNMQLQTLCNAMTNLPALTNLSLTKLSCGPDGYQALANLLTENKNLDQLKVSVHLFKPLPSLVDQVTSGSPEDMTQWVPSLITAARRRIDGLASIKQQLAKSFKETERNKLLQVSSPPLSTVPSEDTEEEVHMSLSPRSSTSPTESSLEYEEDGPLADNYEVHDENDLPNFDALNLTGNVVRTDSAIKVTTLTLERKKPPKLASTRGRTFYKDTLRSKQESTEQPELSFMQKVCVPESHVSGFHSLLSVLRDPRCCLKRLDLTNCLLKEPDMVCLGQSLANNVTLKSLRIAGTREVESALAIVESLPFNQSLTWLDLTSFKLQLDTKQTEHVFRILTNPNHRIEQLSLAGWSFTFQDTSLLTHIKNYLNSKACPIKELNLSECHLHVKLNSSQSPNKLASLGNSQDSNLRLGKEALVINSSTLASFSALNHSQRSQDDSTHSNDGRLIINGRKLGKAGPWPSIEKLALSGTTVTVDVEGQTSRTLRGLQLLQQIHEVTNLRDLRLDKKPDHEKLECLNDEASRDLFRYIARKFGQSLRKLHLSGWHFSWSKPEQTMAFVTNELRKCQQLSYLKLNFVRYRVSSVQSSQEKLRRSGASENEEYHSHHFLKAVAQGLPQLRDVSLIGMELNEQQALQFADVLRSKWPKGKESLRLHTRLLGQHAEAALVEGLSSGLKLVCEDLGGMQGTWLVRRREKLCSALISIFRRDEKPKHDETDENDCDHPRLSTVWVGNNVTHSSFVFNLGILSAHYVA